MHRKWAVDIEKPFGHAEQHLVRLSDVEASKTWTCRRLTLKSTLSHNLKDVHDRIITWLFFINLNFNNSRAEQGSTKSERRTSQEELQRLLFIATTHCSFSLKTSKHFVAFILLCFQAFQKLWTENGQRQNNYVKVAENWTICQAKQRHTHAHTQASVRRRPPLANATPTKVPERDTCVLHLSFPFCCERNFTLYLGILTWKVDHWSLTQSVKSWLPYNASHHEICVSIQLQHRTAPNLPSALMPIKSSELRIKLLFSNAQLFGLKCYVQQSFLQTSFDEHKTRTRAFLPLSFWCHHPDIQLYHAHNCTRSLEASTKS